MNKCQMCGSTEKGYAFDDGTGYECPRCMSNVFTDHVTTLELHEGDRIALPGGLVRTVAEVVESGYLNRHDQTIYNVMYLEPAIAGVWGAGNSGTAGARWQLANEYRIPATQPSPLPAY